MKNKSRTGKGIGSTGGGMGWVAVLEMVGLVEEVTLGQTGKR